MQSGRPGFIGATRYRKIGCVALRESGLSGSTLNLCLQSAASRASDELLIHYV